MIVTTSDPLYLGINSQYELLPIGSPAAISDPEYPEGVDQNEVEPIGTTRISFIPIPPFNFTIVQQSDALVDVDFGVEMKNDAELVDPANYSVAPHGAGIGVSVVIVAVTRLGARKIRLEISLATDGEVYVFEVVGGAVKRDTGESAAGASGSYLADVTPPAVASVRSVSQTAVEVTFTRDMDDNADLVDPTKYTFTDGLFASGVERTGSRTVVVNTSAQIDGVTYTIRVFP